MTAAIFTSRRCLAGPILLLLLATSLVPHPAHGGGVVVVDATTGNYLVLKERHVRVSVENQVALITATEVFYNPANDSLRAKYAFPMPAGASATSLRWKVNGVWYDASFDITPADSTLPGSGDGGSLDPDLLQYLGEMPLFFDIEQHIGSDSLVTVQLTYAQLLPYAFGEVTFEYPNDYSLIQQAAVDVQTLDFTLTSTRTIEAVDLRSHNATGLTNDGFTATVSATQQGVAATTDYRVQYALSLDELGLFGFSTFLPDSLRVEEGGPGGFFLFVAEPDPTEGVDVIEKVFTLIVDRSGSMSGTKIVQARNAATFVVENLNEGDRFNIVDFSSNVTSFRSSHVPFTPENEQAALDYVSRLQAAGSTFISGAFETAIPQFDAASDETANIIVFFTDGLATAGITDTEALLARVRERIDQHEVAATIFTFGIGSNVNRQLLTRLAAENGGFSEFLENDALEDRLTEFYLQIRNPVLLDTEVSFSPDVISEVYPAPLPNLYQGQQMLVGGRYRTPGAVTVTLSGNAFGQPVSYQYPLALADSNAARLQFLPKVWAKLKIEDLLVDYYSLDPVSSEAEAIKEEVIALSLGYGVLSPFTSFNGGVVSDDQGDGDVTGVEEATAEVPQAAAAVELLGNYPNPFRDQTTIRFRLHAPVYDVVLVRIYDLLGRLVRVIAVPVQGAGTYEAVWEGLDESGVAVPAGTYIFTLSAGDAVLGGKLVRVR